MLKQNKWVEKRDHAFFTVIYQQKQKLIDILYLDSASNPKTNIQDIRFQTAFQKSAIMQSTYSVIIN